MESTFNGFQASANSSQHEPDIIQGDTTADSFFSSDIKKSEQLKEYLDGNKEMQKLDAMKQIVGLMARGKSCSDLFPSVVKNVVSKNPEVKKLVYVYLTRYAEEQQDLALLSVSTFQRALKDPNQLIRGSALRVLSSIRVPIIVPILILAVKDASGDLSPYVRKTAANALPKLYSLESSIKDELLNILERLLNDNTTLVAGSAVQAFEEICPERFDLIHKHYRKICGLLIDIDEWGQVVIIGMLTRYARNEFAEPKSDNLDPDHALLLRLAKPLLNCCSSAVVLAVVQLIYYIGPRNELSCIAKALIRLLHSAPEIQYIVLHNIASLSLECKEIFQPFLKSFFVHNSDSPPVKRLKLEVLTNLAGSSNAPILFKELKSLIDTSDKDVAPAAVQAFGRLASILPDLMDQTLGSLISMISRNDDVVVAESVIVLQKLLQSQNSDNRDVITQMALLVDGVVEPKARASILWLIGEHVERIPKLAPDVLRKSAKTFCQEANIVKLQIINLAAKLAVVNFRQTRLLAHYVFSLAKYDQNYDLRCRARYLRALAFPTDSTSFLQKYSKKILLCTKPAPIMQSAFAARSTLQLGTMSHLLGAVVPGHRTLASWSTDPPISHAALRAVEQPIASISPQKSILNNPKQNIGSTTDMKNFYSDIDSLDDAENLAAGEAGLDEEDEDDEEEEEEDEDEEEEEEEEDDDEEEENETDEDLGKKIKKVSSDDNSEEEEEEEEDDDNDEEDNDDEEEEEKDHKVNIVKKGQENLINANNSTSAFQHSNHEDVKSCQKNQLNSDKKLYEEQSSSDEESGLGNIVKSEEDYEDEEEVEKQKSTDIINTKNNTHKTNKKSKNAHHTPQNNTLLDLSDFNEPDSSKNATLIPSKFSEEINSKPELKNSYKPISCVQSIMVEFEAISELEAKLQGHYLCVKYKFSRVPIDPNLTSLDLLISNVGSEEIQCIELIPTAKLHSPIQIIESLSAGDSKTTQVVLELQNSVASVDFSLKVDKFPNIAVRILPKVGELLRPVSMSLNQFTKHQMLLKGLAELESEVATQLVSNQTEELLAETVLSVANVLLLGAIENEDDLVLHFASCLSDASYCLIELFQKPEKIIIKSRCENPIILTQLDQDLKKAVKSIVS